MENKSNTGALITPRMTKIIEELQTEFGTAQMYVRAIDKMEELILMRTDEIGITSWTAMDLLRSLRMLKEDIKALAIPGHGEGSDDPDENLSATDYDAVLEGVNPFDPFYGHNPEEDTDEDEEENATRKTSEVSDTSEE